MDFNSVYRNYQPQLKRVEGILHQQAQANEPVLAYAGRKLLDAGGKRLRPLFALICGKTNEVERNVERVAKVAAALELTHMATLVHDDVIDEADLRRGRPTVRSEHGNLAAMYTGDFLFARAIQLLAEVDDAQVHQAMSQGLVRLCQGEIEQIQDFFQWNQSIRTYLRRIERKTALLIALSCSLSARVAGASNEDISALRRFGYYTGMAFQIIDDVLDFTSSVQVIGKPVGGDLRQGNITLPALLAAQDGAIGRKLTQLVQRGMSDHAAEEAITLIVNSPALTQARAVAERYLQKALQMLDRIRPSSIKEELTVLSAFVAERSF